MDIIGDRKFVEIPGNRMHELPPLLVHRHVELDRADKVVGLAERIVESEEMVPPAPFPEEPIALQQRRFDLAINLVEQYKGLLLHWRWGNDILEWIRQCETTFELRQDLRHLLRGDLWPHAGRSSFVQLLEDKAVETGGVDMERAVGLRLTFRHPPPISCFSNQFLFYLNETVATSAFQAWASRNPAPISSLPPERFEFHVLDM